MKKFFTKKKIIILTSIVLVMALTVGAYAVFGKRLEEVAIPTDADLSVTTMAKPESGTPADYDPKTNLYVAQGIILQKSFSTHTEGATDCGVVNQDIHAERVVTPSATYKKSISYSSLVQVGVEYYAKNNQYLIREAARISSITDYKFLNEDKYLTKLNETAFQEAYGKPCRGLTAYIINNSTVLETFSGGRDQDGLHKFTYKLDPLVSTANIKNEMKTMAGSKKYPVVTEVEFSIWIDDDWVVNRTHASASYKVEKGPIVASCTEDTTEYFTISDVATIPNEDYFSTKIETTSVSENVEHTESATDILLDAFGKYLDGTTPLSLSFSTDGKVKLNGDIDLYIDAENLEKIKAVANIEDILKLQYNNEDGMVYVSIGKTKDGVSNNKLNLSLNINDNADTFKALLEKLNINFDFDMENINTAELLSALNIENGDQTLSLTFNKELAGITIDAKIDLDKQTNKITADIKINDTLTISVASKDESLQKLVDENNKNSFKDAKPIIDSLLNSENLILQLNSDIVNGKIQANIFDKIILGELNIFGKNVTFEFSDQTLWLEIDGILTKFDAFDNLFNSKLVASLMPNFDIKIDDILNEVLDNLTIIEDENSFIVTTSILNIPVNINFTLNNNGLILNTISTTLQDHEFIVSLATEFDRTQFSADKKLEAIDLNNIVELLNKDSFNLCVSLSGHELILNIDTLNKSITGLLDNQLKLKLENKTLYGIYNDLQFRITTDEVLELVNKIVTDLNLSNNFSIDIENINIQELISSISLAKEDNNLIINLPFSGKNIEVLLDIENNLIDLTKASINVDNLSLTITKSTPLQFSIDTAENYINAYEVVNNYYSTILNIIRNKEITLFGQIDVTIPTENSDNKQVINIRLSNIALNFQDTKNLKVLADITITTTTFDNGKTTTKEYSLKLNYYNNRVYFEFDGLKGQFGTDTVSQSKENLTSILNNVPQLQALLESLSKLANINMNIKEWDLYSLLKNITIDDSLNMVLNIDLSTILADSNTLNDLVIGINKADNGGLDLVCDIDNLVNNISVSFNVNVAPTTGTDFNVQNENDYTNFDSMNNLVEVLANTVGLRHFHVSADLNIKIKLLNIKCATITLDLQVDVLPDGTFSAVVVLNHSSPVGFENNTCTTTLYILPNYDYIYGTKYYKSHSWSSSFKTEYFKISKDEVNNKTLNVLAYLLDLNSKITKELTGIDTSNSNTNVKAGDILKSYSYSEQNRNYSLKLDLSKINSSLGDANINIKHTEKTENQSAKLEQISADLSLISIASINITGNLVDQNNQDYNTLSTVNNFISTNGSKCTAKTF